MTLQAIRHYIISHLQYLYNLESLPTAQLRKLGLIYSIYRCVVSAFLMMTGYATFQVSNNGAKEGILPTLLQQTTLSFYLLFSVILLGLFYFVSKRPQRQLAFGLAIDVIILSLLLYTSGAPDLQLTMLYMVVVAASFMLLTAPQALIITLMAIIFVIYQQFFFAIANSLNLSNLGDALLMSLSFLAVGFLSWTTSQRLVQVEKMAEIHAKEVSRLNAINHEVISKMVSGVLVIDNQKVVLANQAACQLLHVNAYFEDDDQALSLLQHQLTSLHPELCDWFLSFQRDESHPEDTPLASSHPNATRQSYDTGAANTKEAASLLSSYPYTFIYELPPFASTSLVDKLRVELTPLKNNSQLLIIEDLRREQAGAQQLKLASLGQLTASIAHEIRNPLATISQASQLLLEDIAELDAQNAKSGTNLDHSLATQAQMNDNRELYQMIFTQTKRVNRIIEDVLKLSRQQKPQRKAIAIEGWMRQFLSEHFQAHDVFLKVTANPIIYFDPHQLEQVLVNLINNGLRYSSRSHPHAFVEIEIYCLDNDAIIDILDEGNGVKTADLPRLFDPFFTTDAEGTGLGLYLSQAFTEANHARLLYVPEHQKTCFRLIIPLRHYPAQDFGA